MPADLGLSEIQSVISTNVTAVMACCKETINSMKKHDIKDGHIININRYADSQKAKKKDCGHFVCCQPKEARLSQDRCMPDYSLVYIRFWYLRLANTSLRRWCIAGVSNYKNLLI